MDLDIGQSPLERRQPHAQVADDLADDLRDGADEQQWEGCRRQARRQRRARATDYSNEQHEGDQRRRDDVEQPARPGPSPCAARTQHHTDVELLSDEPAQPRDVQMEDARLWCKRGTMSHRIEPGPQRLLVGIERIGQLIPEGQQRLAPIGGVVDERIRHLTRGPVQAPVAVVEQIGRPAHGAGGIRVADGRHDRGPRFFECRKQRLSPSRLWVRVRFTDEHDRRGCGTHAGSPRGRQPFDHVERDNPHVTEPVEILAANSTFGRRGQDDDRLDLFGRALLPKRGEHRPDRVVRVGRQHDGKARAAEIAVSITSRSSRVPSRA